MRDTVYFTLPRLPLRNHQPYHGSHRHHNLLTTLLHRHNVPSRDLYYTALRYKTIYPQPRTYPYMGQQAPFSFPDHPGPFETNAVFLNMNPFGQGSYRIIPSKAIIVVYNRFSCSTAFCNNYTKGTQAPQMEETAASFKAEIFSISCGLTALIPPSMPSIKTNGLPPDEDYHPYSS